MSLTWIRPVETFLDFQESPEFGEILISR